MRRRLILVVLGAAVVAAVFVWAVRPGGQGGREEQLAGAVAVLQAQSVQAGDVEVRIEPRRVDEDGAVFAVSFDTHSVELSLDVAGSAALEVGGVPWSRPVWEGDPAAGHHRSGELRFDADGPASGEVQLSIGGLAEKVEASWDLPERAP